MHSEMTEAQHRDHVAGARVAVPERVLSGNDPFGWAICAARIFGIKKFSFQNTPQLNLPHSQLMTTGKTWNKVPRSRASLCEPFCHDRLSAAECERAICDW